MYQNNSHFIFKYKRELHKPDLKLYIQFRFMSSKSSKSLSPVREKENSPMK